MSATSSNYLVVVGETFVERRRFRLLMSGGNLLVRADVNKNKCRVVFEPVYVERVASVALFGVVDDLSSQLLLVGAQ